MDPIGDLLTRIRNAYRARIILVEAPHSKIRENILKILKKNSYIASYEVVGEGPKKTIKITLNNVKETRYVPNFIRVSTPGQRIYVQASDIKKSRNGKGIYIFSTPKGVITGYEARSLNVGGELICEVY